MKNNISDKYKLNKAMIGWLIDRMKGWMNEWMFDRMDGWKDAWMAGSFRMDEKGDEWMNGWMDEWINEYLD